MGANCGGYSAALRMTIARERLLRELTRYAVKNSLVGTPDTTFPIGL